MALGLVTAALSRTLLPMFQWFLISSRDVMLIWFLLIGYSMIGLMAWHLSPAYTWLTVSSIASAALYGFQGDTVPNVTALALGVVILVVLSQGWKDYKHYIYVGLLVGVLANLGVAAMQGFVRDLGWPAPAGLVYRDPYFAVAAHVREIEGLASHYSLLAGFLVVALPLLVSHFRYGWLLVFPSALHIFYAQHRGSAIALLALLWLVPKRYAKYAIIAVLIFVAGVLYVRGSFNSVNAWTGDRSTVWTITLAKAMQKPILGWGPGTFNLWRPTFFIGERKLGLTFTQAHNEYLQGLFEIGILGMLAVPLFWITVGRRLWRARPWSQELRGAVASFVVLSFICAFSFPLRIGMTAFGAIITLVVLHGELLAREDVPCLEK